MSGTHAMTAEYVRGQATDTEIANHDARQAAPWTLAEYARLHEAVKALYQSRVFHEEGGVLVASTVWWRLLGALGRDGQS